MEEVIRDDTRIPELALLALEVQDVKARVRHDIGAIASLAAAEAAVAVCVGSMQFRFAPIAAYVCQGRRTVAQNTERQGLGRVEKPFGPAVCAASTAGQPRLFLPNASAGASKKHPRHG